LGESLCILLRAQKKSEREREQKSRIIRMFSFFLVRKIYLKGRKLDARQDSVKRISEMNKKEKTNDIQGNNVITLFRTKETENERETHTHTKDEDILTIGELRLCANNSV